MYRQVSFRSLLDIEKQESVWKVERSGRKESAKNLDIDIGPGALHCHRNSSILDSNGTEINDEEASRLDPDKTEYSVKTVSSLKVTPPV